MAAAGKKKLKKKKLVRVEEYSSGPYADTNNTIGFAFVSPPEDGRRQCHKSHGCKDYLHEIVRGTVHKSCRSGQHGTDDPPLDLKNLKLLFRHDKTEDWDEWKAGLFSAKKALNFYEKLAGWDQSKISTVVLTNKGKDTEKRACLLTGPKEWLLSPHLVSMVALIMRVGTNYGKFDFKGQKSLDAVWKKMANSGKKDSTYINRCAKFFPVIMKCHDYIFEKDINKNYPDAKFTSSFHGCGGIDSLCNYNSNNQGFNNRLLECMKKFGKEK